MLHRSHRFASLFVAAALLTISAPASASHPSLPSWTSTIAADDTTDCLTIAEPATQQAVLDVDNQCDDYFTVTEVRCDPVECSPQEPGVENGVRRDLTAFELGLPVGSLQEDDSVAVEIDWALNEMDTGTIVLDVTFDGYVGGEHNFDMGTGIQPDAGDDAGNGGDDAGTGGGGDTGSPSGGGSSGSKSAPSGCGGCTSAEASASPLAALLFFIVLCGRRRFSRA